MVGPTAFVSRAAKMLDKRYPGWFRKIRLSKPDLGDITCCVTTQLGVSLEEQSNLPSTVLRATLWEGTFLRSDVQKPWENEIRARRRKAKIALNA